MHNPSETYEENSLVYLETLQLWDLGCIQKSDVENDDVLDDRPVEVRFAIHLPSWSSQVNLSTFVVIGPLVAQFSLISNTLGLIFNPSPDTYPRDGIYPIFSNKGMYM
jgi:hypothetical protein